MSAWNFRNKSPSTSSRNCIQNYTKHLWIMMHFKFFDIGYREVHLTFFDFDEFLLLPSRRLHHRRSLGGVSSGACRRCLTDIWARRRAPRAIIEWRCDQFNCTRKASRLQWVTSLSFIIPMFWWIATPKHIQVLLIN